jgi:tetratricopeptide (TPR) repeat protein
MGLRILTPVVRPQRDGQDSEATPAERAEYAILLQRAGSVHEAIQILEGIPPEEEPSAPLFRAFCHFNIWEYENAIPFLELYVSRPADAYQALIGRVNLSAAYLATGKMRQAESLLRQCIESARAGGYSRLEGNAHELLSQVFLFEDRLGEAESSLKIAEHAFDSAKSLDQLLVGKCKAFLEARKTNSSLPLKEFRRKAAEWPHAETMREIDLFTIMTSFEKPVFDHLYFGTPFAPYRERIVTYTGRAPEQKIYRWGAPGGDTLNATSGELAGGLKLSGVSHRLVEKLTRDFYRPVSTNGLFAALFPDEYFNIFTSPTRVHQVLRRTRRWFEENRVPVQIASEPAGFSLKLTGEFAFEVQLEREAVGKGHDHLRKLEAHFNGQEFSATQARNLLGLSPSGTQRFLTWAKDGGHIASFGASTSTIYYLKDKKAA